MTRRRRWAAVLLGTLVAAVGAVLRIGPPVVDWAWRNAARAAEPVVRLGDEARQRRNRTETHATKARFWERSAARCEAGQCVVRPIPEEERGRDVFGYFPRGTTLHELDDRPPWLRGRTTSAPGTLDPARSAASCRDRAVFHRAMERKWRWAARFPWTRVADDPPGPPLVYDPGPDPWDRSL